MLHGITRPWHHPYRWCSMKPKRAASIYPTVDEINALPERFRQYIHDLETRCEERRRADDSHIARSAMRAGLLGPVKYG
jgi:hypothetical protein